MTLASFFVVFNYTPYSMMPLGLRQRSSSAVESRRAGSQFGGRPRCYPEAPSSGPASSPTLSGLGLPRHRESPRNGRFDLDQRKSTVDPNLSSDAIDGADAGGQHEDTRRHN